MKVMKKDQTFQCDRIDMKDCHSHHECCGHFHERMHEHFRHRCMKVNNAADERKVDFSCFFLLKLIDNMDVKEVDGNSVEMALKIDGIPEELKQAIHEKL